MNFTHSTAAKTEAEKVVEHFRSREGSRHIGGSTSLATIIDVCLQDKPKRVLELGAGIGTMTYVLIKYSEARVDTYESNQWCLGQLSKNLPQTDRVEITRTYRLLPPATEYDFVIVDGGSGSGGDTDDGKMRTVYLFLKYLERVGKVYVDGNRTGQRVFVRRALKDRYLFRPVRFAPHGGDQGGTLYLLRPSRSKLRWLNWLFWEFMERIRK